MLLVTVLVGLLFVGRGSSQNTTEEETTTVTVDIDQQNTTTVAADIDQQETTTVTADIDQQETTTLRVDIEKVETITLTTEIYENEIEAEELREQCLYKQKRPGFTCDSGECVDRGGVCDQHQDCSDGSDETISCCSSTCITPTSGSVCIPSDGYNYTNVDCRSCSKSGYPGYRCDDGACIYRRKVCDGRSQCKDNSDEKYCAFHLCQTDLGAYVNVPRDMLDKTGDCRKCDYNREGDGFRCNNAKCILAAWKCDGTAECSDGSDETNQLCKPQVVQDVLRQPKVGRTWQHGNNNTPLNPLFQVQLPGLIRQWQERQRNKHLTNQLQAVQVCGSRSVDLY